MRDLVSLDMHRDHVTAQQQEDATQPALVEHLLHQDVLPLRGDTELLLVLRERDTVSCLSVHPEPGEHHGVVLLAHQAQGPHHVLHVVANSCPLQLVPVEAVMILEGSSRLNFDFDIANETGFQSKTHPHCI